MLTLSEAAEQLGISRAALDNWIKRLEIEKKKEGPFDQVREAHYSLLKMFKNDNVFQDISTGSSEKEFSLDRKTMD